MVTTKRMNTNTSTGISPAVMDSRPKASAAILATIVS